MRQLLEPLRLYDWTGGSVSASEITAAGGGLNYVQELMYEAERDAQPLTSGEAGLSLWESILPHNKPSGTEARRRAISALIGTTDRAFTPGLLAASLTACGLKVAVRELGTGRVEINFPDVGGVPPGFNRITATLDMLLPCHLQVEYRFNYLTWELFERIYATWAVFDAAGRTWEQVELTWK